jgi:hypothetical protein
MSSCRKHAFSWYYYGMDWSTRRKLLYIIACIVFLSTFGIYSLKDIIFSEPTCFDSKKNGFESGVDCGGSCSLRCTQDIIPLVVKWSQAVWVSEGRYDLVALVANKNIDNAPRAIGYLFSVYDDKGALIASYRASTTAPIDGDFPVVIQNVSLPDTVKTVTVDVSDSSHYTVPSKPSRSVVLNPDNIFEQGDIPRVYSQVVNTSQLTLQQIPAIVLLYDEKDTVYAVNKTIIPLLKPEESRKLSFTWPGTAMREPTKIRLYLLLDPFGAQ